MKPAKNRKRPKRARARPEKHSKLEREAQAKRLASLPYSEYLKTLHWARLRKAALARWGGWCEGCGVRPALEVHHKTYARLGRERLSDLSPLCGACHRAEHKGSAEPPRRDTTIRNVG